ncbi:MAG: hypothetical protein OEV30_03775 [Ignavibacteria bacterium]|nr:hypothetical protein [Ignavibacteria bacterium]
MLRKPVFLIIALMALSSLSFALEPLKEGSLSAESNGNSIVIRWMSEDESRVTSFEIERKAGLTSQFFLLAAVAPLGNNSSYEYVDDTAFRVGAESIYAYRIRAVFEDGSSAYSGEVTVIHAVSSVRRTWGSIKAMFR